MDSRLRKTIRKNAAGIRGSRQKKLCPMCLIRLEEIPVVFDEEIKSYKCNICGYIVPKHLDPVGDSIVEAGNAESATKPYMASVQFHKSIKNRRVTDVYDSPYDALHAD